MTILKENYVNQDQEWIKKGVDVWLIRENLKLSFEERIAQHENMLNLINELNEIGRKNRAKSSGLTQTTHSKSR